MSYCKQYLKLAVFLLLLLYRFPLQAQINSYSGTDLQSGLLDQISITSVEDNYDQQIKVHERLLKAVFHMRSTEDFFPLATTGSSNWSVTLSLTIDALDEDGTVLKTYDADLTLNETVAEKYLIIDFAPLDASIASFDITVNSNPFAGSGSLTNILRSNAQLDITFEDYLGYGITNKAGTKIRPDNLRVIPLSQVVRSARFMWDIGTDQHFDSYDLEVLKAEPSADGTVEIDWRKASTIEVENATQYSMTLAEGTGLYFWRVRPVGSYYPGGRSDYRNYGRWSIHAVQSDGAAGYCSMTTNSDGLLVPDFSGVDELAWGAVLNGHHFYYEQFDDELNWIYSKVLTENSRQAETMTYADGLYQARQTQTKLFTPQDDGSGSPVQHVVATQTVYDYAGRPALQSLPAPTGNEQIGYKEDFFLNSTGTDPFTAADFDADETTLFFDSYSSTDSTVAGTPFHYYSDENTQGVKSSYVPTAKAFPFIRTRYYGDGTGRVYQQAAPGKTMRMDREISSNNTITLYGSVLQDELDRIFGNEAPVDSTTYKVVTLDPNDVTSMKYVSKKGNVLATSLIETGSSELLDVGTADINTISAEFAPGVLAAGERMARSSKTIVVEEPTRQIDLSYTLDPASFDLPCPTTTGNCDYHVEIEIKNPQYPDDVTKNVMLSFNAAAGSTVTLPGLSGATTTGPGGQAPGSNLSTIDQGYVELSFGSYIIEKRIYVNNKNPSTGSPYLDEAIEALKREAQSWTATNNCNCNVNFNADDFDCNEDEEPACELTLTEIAEELHEYVLMEQNSDYYSSLTDQGDDLLSQYFTDIDDFTAFIQQYIEDQGTIDQDGCKFTWDCFQNLAGFLEHNIEMVEAGATPYPFSTNPYDIPDGNGGDYYDPDFDLIKAVLQCMGEDKVIGGLLEETTHYPSGDANIDPMTFINFPHYPHGFYPPYRTITYTGLLYAPVSGSYTFTLSTEFTSTLQINGISNDKNCADSYHPSININLTGNEWYEIIVTLDTRGCSNTYETQLLWTPPGGSQHQIPPENFAIFALDQSECLQYSEANVWSGDINNKENTEDILDIELPAGQPGEYGLQLARNAVCVQTYFADDIYDRSTETYVSKQLLLEPRNGLTKEEATQKTCECMASASEIPDDADVPLTSEMQQVLIDDCNAGCAENSSLFEAAIDNYIYEVNAQNGIYSPDHADWDGFTDIFPNQSNKECLIDAMIADCESKCQLPLIDESLLGQSTTYTSPQGNTYSTYEDYLESDEYLILYDQQLQALELARSGNVNIAQYDVSGRYSEFGTPEQTHREITDFFYTALEEGMNIRDGAEMDGTLGSPSATYSISLQNPQISAGSYYYMQRKQPFVLKTKDDAGNPYNRQGVAVVNVIQEEVSALTSTVLKIREINVAVYCDGSTTPLFYWSYRPSPPCDYFSFIPAGGYQPEAELVTFFFDPSGRFYAIEKDVCGRILETNEVCTQESVELAELTISGAAGDYWNIEAAKGDDMAVYINSEPVLWHNDDATTASSMVAAINTQTVQTGIWATNEDGSGTATSIITLHTATGTNSSPYNITFELTGVNTSSLTYPSSHCSLSLGEMMNEYCSGSANDLNNKNCPYGYTHIEEDPNSTSGTICDLCVEWQNPRPTISFPSPVEELSECEKQKQQYIATQTATILEGCLEEKIAELESNYRSSCLNNISDQFSISYEIDQRHYTLYYYDRAGNLIRTVPPEGVKFLSQTEIDEVRNHRKDRVTYPNPVTPDHILNTTYKYNSLGQLIEQSLPDQDGVSGFYYNDAGQQVLTIKPNGDMVYTKYDRLGRVIETGKVNGLSINVLEGNVLDEAKANLNFPDNMSGINKEEVTRTVYSLSDGTLEKMGLEQRNLRNRISRVFTDDGVTTYYSYDPHGNVELLVQDIPEIGNKVIRYEYDLVSGNVKEVWYQEGTNEQFIHRYEYDEDNRIINVFTSTDGIHWDRDAGYNYYVHGPLARAELGEDKLQGIDHVYTVEGYLKTINQPELLASKDPGGDGTTGSSFLEDEFGMELGYYAGDYYRSGIGIGSSRGDNLDPFYGTNSTIDRGTRSLFNGNISYWISNTRTGNKNIATNSEGVKNPRGIKFRAFQYDQLNRLRGSDFFYSNAAGTGWSATTDYDESFEYDGNGNIKNLTRYGNNGLMDDMDYEYEYDNGLVSNRLYHVTENPAISSGTYTTDIDDQGTFSSSNINTSNNYGYDAMGNLTRDDAEGIEDIQWNILNKVSLVKKYDAINSEYFYLLFEYDAMGNRVMKKETAKGTRTSTTPDKSPDELDIEKTTYYVRDATGNIMAVYTRDCQGSATEYKLAELPIYGSSRIGQYQPNTTIATASGCHQGEVSDLLDLTSTATEMVKWTVPTDNNILTLDFSTSGSVSKSTFTTVNSPAKNTALELDENDNIILATAVVNNELKIYDNGGTLFSSLPSLSAEDQANAQPVIMKDPDPANAEHYYIVYYPENSNTYRELRYVHVDAASSSVVSEASFSGGLTFGRKLIDVTFADGTSRIIGYHYNGTTYEIYGVDITAGGIQPPVYLGLKEGSSPGGANRDMALSPDGKYLALTLQNTIALWEVDLSCGELLNFKELSTAGNIFNSIAFPPRAIEFSKKYLYYTLRRDIMIGLGQFQTFYYIERLLTESGNEEIAMISGNEIMELQRTVEGKIIFRQENNMGIIRRPDAAGNTDVSIQQSVSLSLPAMNHGLPQQTHHSEEMLSDKVPVQLPEQYNWLAATKGTNSQSGVPDIHFGEENVNVSNTSSETGKSVYKNIAVAENADGFVQFKFFVTEDGVSHLVDGENNPLDMDGHTIPADYDSKSITIKVPGQNKRYYLITQQGKILFYHDIDMAEGKVVSANNMLAFHTSPSVNVSHYALAVYNDVRSPNSPTILYVADEVHITNSSSFPPTTNSSISLQVYNVTESGITSENTVQTWSAESPHTVGLNEMHISPQGDELGIGLFHPKDFFDPGGGIETALIKISQAGPGTGTGIGLQDVHFTDVNTGFIAGESGTFYTTTNGGHSWQKENTKTKKDLTSVFFTDLQTGFIGGEQGLLMKTTNGGQNWQDKQTGTQQTIQDIYFTDSQTGFVTGDQGSILKTTDGGQSWQEVSQSTNISLEAIYFTDNLQGFATGANGTMLTTTDGGQNWQQQQTSVTQSINAIAFEKKQDPKGLALAAQQKLLHTPDKGQQWQEHTLSHTVTMNDMGMGGNEIAASVGDQGMLMFSRDNGQTWEQDQVTTENLNAVTVTDNGVAYAVGDNGQVVMVIPRELAEEQFLSLISGGTSTTASGQEILQSDLKRIHTGDATKEQIVRFKERQHSTELRRGKDGKIYVNTVRPGDGFDTSPGTGTGTGTGTGSSTGSTSTSGTTTDSQLSAAIPGPQGWEFPHQVTRYVHKIVRYDLDGADGSLRHKGRLVIDHENIAEDGNQPYTSDKEVLSWDYTENSSYIYYAQMTDTLKTAIEFPINSPTALHVFDNTEVADKQNIVHTTLNLNSGTLNYGLIWQPYRIFEDKCVPNPGSAKDGYFAQREVGKKVYEISDHLGSVRVTFADRRMANVSGNSITWELDVTSMADYYSFGMLMPGRSYNAGNYRYGLQGQEMDNEIKGVGNSINFKFRMFDLRLGRFFAVDPLFRKYPMLTTYQFAGNRVIDHVELEGLEGADYRFRQQMKSQGGARAAAEEYAEQMQADAGKFFFRFGTPIEDIWGLATGTDFDGQPYNRAEAGVWFIASFVPGSKAMKPVVKVVKGSSKIAGRVGNFASKTLLNQHFEKHAAKFGGKFRNAEEYAKGAQEFFNREGDDILEYTREGGEVVKYDKANNIFGVAKEDGTIKTFFKPDDGADYFKNQVKKDLGEDVAETVGKTLE